LDRRNSELVKETQMADEKVVTLTDADFEEKVLKAGLPVLVDFWAAWCGPCRMMSPVVDELAAAYDGKVRIGKMNVDENPLTPSRYGVRGIPNVKLFQGGKVVDEVVGAVPRPKLEEMIKKVL
jgi:thioredoxin 1